MATKLTDEERARMDILTDDELRIEIELAVRKRKTIKLDKQSYAKACNDLIALQEGRMDYAVDVLERRELERGKAPSPSPSPKLPASGGKPPPPPPVH